MNVCIVNFLKCSCSAETYDSDMKLTVHFVACRSDRETQ